MSDVEKAVIDEFMSDMDRVVVGFLARIGKPQLTEEAEKRISEKLSSSFEEWEHALRSLPFISLFDYDSDFSEHRAVFWLYFPGDRSEAHPDFEEELSGDAKFKGDGTATIDTADDHKEGTWQEIYQELVRFVTTELELPPLPKGGK